MDLDALPGGELIVEGLADLHAGRESAASLLVEIGRTNLLRLGFDVPEPRGASPEHRLYLRLAGEDPRRAHSRYNALVRRLVSFERAARCVR